MNCGIEKNYLIDPLLCIGNIEDNQYNGKGKLLDFKEIFMKVIFLSD